MKMKRLVTPAQAGYERMRERQKQRRDAANGAPSRRRSRRARLRPGRGGAFVARLELSMYEKTAAAAPTARPTRTPFESFKAALAVDDDDISDGELQP